MSTGVLFQDQIIRKITMYNFRTIPSEHEEWFKNLWEKNASEKEFFELAQAIDPEITFDWFDDGWQFTTILNEDYQVAQDQFMIAIEHAY